MKKILLRRLFNLLFHLPDKILIFVINLLGVLWASHVKFGKCDSSNFFFVKDNYSKRYFCNIRRGILFYYTGTRKRGEKLFNKYCLDKIKFEKTDIVIDCGANQADLYLSLSNFISPENYIAIEPGPDEFNCLEMSLCSGERLFNLALGDRNGYMDFFVSSVGADSSLIEPVEFEKIIKVKVQKLKTFFKEAKITTCKLLKVEAEGFEPEILIGAEDVLAFCEYIAISGGPERGIQKEKTLPAATNYLLSRGFVMWDIPSNSYRALFKNQNL